MFCTIMFSHEYDTLSNQCSALHSSAHKQPSQNTDKQPFKLNVGLPSAHSLVNLGDSTKCEAPKATKVSIVWIKDYVCVALCLDLLLQVLQELIVGVGGLCAILHQPLDEQVAATAVLSAHTMRTQVITHNENTGHYSQ